ncbi:hypothetical protein OPQ81_011124 [Rhizoctonia solani]|nr:hypothetical protein OPQ81_011124 [Rhizoctonia solani]
MDEVIAPNMNELDITSSSQSGSESSGDSQWFTTTVVNIPGSNTATEEELGFQLPVDHSYYRILICKNEHKKVIIVDPELYPISANNGDEETEHLQDEILQLGDILMRSNRQQLEGHQAVHSYRGSSFISSFISYWNYCILPLGGMV